MAKVDIDLVANVQGATKTIQKFAGQASRAVNGISDSFLNLKTLAAGAIAGIGFSRLVAAAAEQEQAVQKLNTALALSGELSKENTQDFLDFASALQANSTIGDEVSLGLVGLAKSFGASNEQAKQILQTAADLSAVTGESLESSVRNLSKTLGGLKGELGETQPELRGLTKEQLQNGKAIDVLAKKYEGAARALTKTFSGALNQTGNSFGDLLEEVGEFITSNPAIIAALNLASEVFADLGEVIEANRESFEELISNGIEIFIDLIPVAIRLAGNFVVGLQTMKLGFDAVRLAATIAIGAVLELLDSLLTALENTIVAGITPFVNSIEGIVGALNAVGVVSDETAAAFTAFSAQLESEGLGLSTILDGPIASFDEFQTEAELAFVSTQDSIKNTIDTFNSVAEGTESYSDRLRELTDEARNSDEALQNLSDSNIEITGVAAQAGEQATQTAAKFGEIPKEVVDLRNRVQAAFDLANPIAAVERDLEQLVTTIRNLSAEGTITDFEAVRLEADARAEAEQKIQAIKEKNRGKNLADAQKDAEKIKELSEQGFAGFLGTLTDQIGLSVEKFFKLVGVNSKLLDLSNLIPQDQLKKTFEFTGKVLDVILPSEKFTASFVGASNELLKGAEGARVAISQGLGAAADAFLPGIGPAVGQLTNALSQGPEFVREQIRAFADAIPDLLNNIAQAIPVLIEEFANAAPEIIVALVKAAPAISRAIIIGLARLPFILAQEFASEFAGILDEVFGTTLQTDFDAAAERFAGATEDLQEKYLSSVEDGIERITGNLASGLNTFTAFVENFFGGIVGGIKTAFGDIAEQFKVNLSAPTELLKTFIKGLSNFDFGASFIEKFQFLLKDLTTFSFPEIPALEAPEIVLPPFPELKIPDLKGILNAPFNTVIDLLNSLKIPELRASGKILGRRFDAVILPETDLIPGDIPRLQAGGRVPEGFPNDNFIAGLQSNEEVLDTSTSEQLRNFLDEQEGGRDVNIILQIGEKQLADVLVNINRQGFRVTP